MYGCSPGYRLTRPKGPPPPPPLPPVPTGQQGPYDTHVHTSSRVSCGDHWAKKCCSVLRFCFVFLLVMMMVMVMSPNGYHSLRSDSSMAVIGGVLSVAIDTPRIKPKSSRARAASRGAPWCVFPKAVPVLCLPTRRCVVWWCWWRAAIQIIFPQRPGNGTSLRGVCAVLCGRFHSGVAGGRRFLQQTECI